MDLHANETIEKLEGKLSQITALHEIADIETEYLGRKGIINAHMRNIMSIEPNKRKEYGAEINKLKKAVETKIDSKKASLQKSKTKSNFDTSLPGEKPRIGHLHPTTETIRKINHFFRYLGYSVYTEREIETNEYNFERLNLPEHHPARDLQDTFYIHEPEILLRTHTSSVETRAMSNENMPIRIVVPGRVYRNETSNSTNTSMFYQYEGLVIDKNLSMADLKGTLIEFVKFLYGDDTKTRFRCKYYPQVEPGAGMDIQCSFCQGKGCSVCKYRGWIEVLGSGMVHPEVLRRCGVPEGFNGFAFGMGLDRLVMLRYGINDIRKLYNGELVVR